MTHIHVIHENAGWLDCSRVHWTRRGWRGATSFWTRAPSICRSRRKACSTIE